MAVCDICGGEMLEHVGCKVGTCICKGKSYARIKFGCEKGMGTYYGDGDICPDCFV